MSEMTKAEAPSAHTMAAMTAAAVFVRLADKMNSLYIVTGHALRPCTVSSPKTTANGGGKFV